MVCRMTDRVRPEADGQKVHINEVQINTLYGSQLVALVHERHELR